MLCFKRTNKRQVTCDIVQQDMWGKTPSERGIGETGASWSKNCIFPNSEFKINLLLFL